MATIKRFEDMEAWQKARELTKEVYAASNKGSFAKDFGLRDQIRRAAVSVMSNIAEGFERGATRSSVSSLLRRRVPRQKFELSFMLPSIRNI